MDVTWNKKGAVFFKDKNYEEALNCFSNALRIDPFNSVFLVNRSAAYAQLGRSLEALQDADNALRITPQNPRALLRKGNALILLQQYEEAWSALESGLSILPGDQELQTALTRAKTHLLVSSPQPSQESISLPQPQPISIPPSSPSSKEVTIENEQQSKPDSQKGLFSSWFSSSKSTGASANKKGVDLLHDGKPVEALKELTSAVENSPNNHHFLCNRASALLELSRHEEALVDIEKALQLAPNFVLGHVRKAKVYSCKNEIEEAKEILNNASKLATSSKDRTLVQNSLQELHRKEVYLSFVQPTPGDDEPPPPYPGK